MSSETLIGSVRSHLEAGGRGALPDVLGEVLAHFGCVTGTIHLLGDGQMLELLAQRGIPESILPMVSKIPVGKGMAGLAAERREPVQVCNLQTDESGDVRPAAKDTKMEGSIAAPMFDSGGGLIGTIGIAKPTAYDYSQAEVSLLAEIGGVVASGIVA